MFNHYIGTNTFPGTLNIALYIRFYKKGDTNGLNHFPPVQTILFFRFILKCVKRFYVTKCLRFLINAQFVFRPKRSTADAILAFIDTIADGLVANDFCLSTILDLCKAFNCVSNKILLSNLEKYDFQEICCAFVKSY